MFPSSAYFSDELHEMDSDVAKSIPALSSLLSQDGFSIEASEQYFEPLQP